MRFQEELDGLLDFWFDPKHKKYWFVQNNDFDSILKEMFFDLYNRATEGKLEDWKKTPEGYLGFIILLDQFSRNYFRNDPKAFAQDRQARQLAKEMIEKGWDKKIDIDKRSMIYLPFEHSENLQDQKLSMIYFAKLDDLEQEYAKRHYDVIKRFGRFPHRNKVLGRETTDDEKKFLKENPMGF